MEEGAEGKSPEAKLFGEHWRDWVRKWVQRICEAAGVPVVTAHGMRGLHSTLARGARRVRPGGRGLTRARIEHDDDAELREAGGRFRGPAEASHDRSRRRSTRLLI